MLWPLDEKVRVNNEAQADNNIIPDPRIFKVLNVVLRLRAMATECLIKAVWVGDGHDITKAEALSEYLVPDLTRFTRWQAPYTTASSA